MQKRLKVTSGALLSDIAGGRPIKDSVGWSDQFQTKPQKMILSVSLAFVFTLQTHR